MKRRSMKQLALSLALGAGLALGGGGTATASGIPVVDLASILNDTTNQAANMAQYVQMIAQYKQQIDQMKQQYQSLSGSRGLGMILNDPNLQNSLPPEWQQVYRSVGNGGYRGLTGAARDIVQANGLHNRCEGRAGSALTLCEREVAKIATDQAFALEAFDSAKDRWTQIEGLMRQINSTTDAKSIAELQARINAEQAAIQNEQTKLQMFAMMAAAEEKLIEQQQREQTRQELSRRGWVQVTPLSAGSL